MSTAHEHRNAGPRDVGAHRRRRRARRCSTSAGATLIRDAFQRLRSADGFSHARSLAFARALVLVQAIIALVGLAAALGKNSASDLIVRSIKAAAPGPAGDLLTSAVTQAQQAGVVGALHRAVLGLVGAIVTGTTLMGQVERALNRLYGVEQDRPTLQKYGRALVLAADGRCPQRVRIHGACVRARDRRRPRRQRGRRHLGRRSAGRSRWC